MAPPTIKLIPYQQAFGLETVKMMRESFHRTMSLQHQNNFNELKGHLTFFSKYNPNHVQVALDTETSSVVGCMVLDGSELEQLYVHVDYQRKGIGAQLLDIAKSQSPDRLELYTFDKNTLAQRFYRKHGFTESSRSYASTQGNPWAKTKEELADIRYTWSAATT